MNSSGPTPLGTRKTALVPSATHLPPIVLVLEAHHTTHIECTQLTIEAERLWAGQAVDEARADDGASCSHAPFEERHPDLPGRAEKTARRSWGRMNREEGGEDEGINGSRRLGG